MKRYSYVEPDENNEPVETIMTETEILWVYWHHWSEMMKKKGDPSMVTKQNCIEDWVVVNWAKEIK